MDAATVTPPIGFGLRKTSEALVSLVFLEPKAMKFGAHGVLSYQFLLAFVC